MFYFNLFCEYVKNSFSKQYLNTFKIVLGLVRFTNVLVYSEKKISIFRKHLIRIGLMR